jgi:hypothetical protein
MAGRRSQRWSPARRNGSLYFPTNTRDLIGIRVRKYESGTVVLWRVLEQELGAPIAMVYTSTAP